MMNIMGKSILSVEQMTAYLRKINASAPEGIENLFIIHGNSEGVRGDLAFCQALLETNSFRYGGTADISWKNTCGLGVTGEANKGQRFKTWSDGVLAQIQHLKAYASTESLKTIQLDERFKLVKRGSAITITDLNGKWAIPGTDYGQKIINIYDQIAKIHITVISLEDEVKNIVDNLSKFIQLDKATWSNILLGKQLLNPAHLKIIFLRLLKVLK